MRLAATNLEQRRAPAAWGGTGTDGLRTVRNGQERLATVSDRCRLLLFSVVAFCVALTHAQTPPRAPHIGYLYPAGGCTGTEFEITLGGQFLRGATEVLVSGDGVHATVLEHVPPLRPLDKEQRLELRRRVRAIAEKRLAELPEETRDAVLRWQEFSGKGLKPQAMMMQTMEESAPSKLPDHPLFRGLEEKSLRELRHLVSTLFDRSKKQRNAQLADMVLVKVVIDAGAGVGDRELRLRTSQGLTNPMCFQVGRLPEAREHEPNDPQKFRALPGEDPVAVPVVLNGQIMPGDVDRLRFRATKGQKLAIIAKARHLIPFLADAVPGWFQATLALFDANDRRLAFSDDYRFDPDPVLFFEVPETGEYRLEIRDSIYRGREDFVYRVAISEQPFITGVFPPGGQIGKATTATVSGWNLPTNTLELDTSPGPAGVRYATLPNAPGANRIAYAVDTLPDIAEAEPNNTVPDAQDVVLPGVVNGRIEAPGDVDIFRFRAKAGDQVVAEVLARRLRSPMDSLVRLMDDSGTILAWNDDHVDKQGHLHRDMGELTHHADSYLCATIPRAGTYCVHVSDAQQHGGAGYAYRLRLSAPRPEFALYVAPSSISMRAGQTVPISVHALRKDGFEGEILLSLLNAPAGFRLAGARVPPGCDMVRATLTAPGEPSGVAEVLHLQGTASKGGQTVCRKAIPSDDVMQAFLWRHLAPSKELMVMAKGRRGRTWPVEVIGDGPIQINASGKSHVRLRGPRYVGKQKVELQLDQPPPGVTLDASSLSPGFIDLDLSADPKTAKPGSAGNLIVEVVTEVTWRKKGDAKAPEQKRRVSLGVLPAIPFEIVAR